MKRHQYVALFSTERAAGDQSYSGLERVGKYAPQPRRRTENQPVFVCAEGVRGAAVEVPVTSFLFSLFVALFY